MQSGSDSCSVNALGKLASKTDSFVPAHLGRIGDYNGNSNVSKSNINETAFRRGNIQGSDGVELTGSHFMEIPQHRGRQLHSGDHNKQHPQPHNTSNSNLAWSREFNNSQVQTAYVGTSHSLEESGVSSHVSTAFGDNHTIPGNPLNSYKTGPPSLQYQTYDYYNIVPEVPVPRTTAFDTDALQQQFDELEMELSQLDLEPELSSSLNGSNMGSSHFMQEEREIFRDTASAIYTFTAESTPYLGEATQTKMANSKFMGLMRTIGNGSINLHDNNKELCSTTTHEIIGNTFINIPESH